MINFYGGTGETNLKSTRVKRATLKSVKSENRYSKFPRNEKKVDNRIRLSDIGSSNYGDSDVGTIGKESKAFYRSMKRGS